VSPESLVGGRTHFDNLNGLLELDNHTTHIRQLRIVSNTLSATGSFDATRDGQLSGNINAEIKMRPGNTALVIYGKVGEQKLRAR
jgi:hypothetical protein